MVRFDLHFVGKDDRVCWLIRLDLIRVKKRRELRMISRFDQLGRQVHLLRGRDWWKDS